MNSETDGECGILVFDGEFKDAVDLFLTIVLPELFVSNEVGLFESNEGDSIVKLLFFLCTFLRNSLESSWLFEGRDFL